MTEPSAFHDGRVLLWRGDCLESLAAMAENSADSCVTDPPYHLQSIVKRFAKTGRTDKTRTTSGPHQRTAAGFMNKQWDGGDIAFRPETWAAVYRVLKPGAYLLAFAGTRTYHRIACGIEDAGFTIYDMIAWAYGQGFPKSHNIALAFESSLCERRPISDTQRGWFYRDTGAPMADAPPFRHPDANEWWGWGTALKPGFEPICLARKPLSESTIAANVARWGCGALNIDGCRVATSADDNIHAKNPHTVNRGGNNIYGAFSGSCPTYDPKTGRFPANLIHDGADEVRAAFPNTAPAKAGKPRHGKNGDGWGMTATGAEYNDDGGSAARFFYAAKADKADRAGSKHPTVKPVDLIQYLTRLVTPKGGVCLDPFAGTGTLAEAAMREGMRAILCEREPEYQADIERRLALIGARDARPSAAPTLDDLPLFASDQEAA